MTMPSNNHNDNGSESQPPALSARELEILDMAASGLTNVSIGARLQLSVHGVEFHLASIYRKLGVSNRTEAAAVYLRQLDSKGAR